MIALIKAINYDDKETGRVIFSSPNFPTFNQSNQRNTYMVQHFYAFDKVLMQPEAGQSDPHGLRWIPRQLGRHPLNR